MLDHGQINACMQGFYGCKNKGMSPWAGWPRPLLGRRRERGGGARGGGGGGGEGGRTYRQTEVRGTIQHGCGSRSSSGGLISSPGAGSQGDRAGHREHQPPTHPTPPTAGAQARKHDRGPTHTRFRHQT